MSSEGLFLLFRNITIALATVMVVKYFIFLVLSAVFPVIRQWRRYRLAKRIIKKHGHIPNYKPLVSVVIPSWNEEVGVLATLRSVLTNTYDNIEVIVVDDGSEDRSRALVDAYIRVRKRRNPRSKRTLKQFAIPNGGKGGALNYGITRSKG